jgi:hypothetical protein
MPKRKQPKFGENIMLEFTPAALVQDSTEDSSERASARKISLQPMLSAKTSPGLVNLNDSYSHRRSE